MKRVLSSLLASLALAGCAGNTSVPFPSPAVAAAQAGVQQVALAASGLDPATLWENEQLANTYACDEWLNEQAEQSSALATGGQLGGLASGAVTPFNPLAGFAGQLFSNALTTLGNAGTLPYATSTAPQVRTAMQSYVQSSPTPMTLAEAGMLGEGQLWYCTPPGIRSLADKAIATAQISAGSPAAAASESFALSTPRAFAPPVITVNGR